MRKIVLILSVAIMTFSEVNKSWAENVVPASGYCNDDKTCVWSLDSSGTLSVSAKDGVENVEMKDYYCEGATTCSYGSGNRPWEDKIHQIQNIVIGDNITKIGRDAFQNATNLKTVSGMKDVVSFGYDAFLYARNLTSITISASASVMDGSVFLYTNLHDVNCVGTSTKCNSLKNLMKHNGATFGDNEFYSLAELVPNCKSYGYGKCISCKNENFKLNDGECDRLRYTPAEAAEVLRDDNTNEVTITFKK